MLFYINIAIFAFGTFILPHQSPCIVLDAITFAIISAIVSETKCSLLSHPDDVMKDDTANELESPLIISGFIVCISVIQRM